MAYVRISYEVRAIYVPTRGCYTSPGWFKGPQKKPGITGPFVSIHYGLALHFDIGSRRTHYDGDLDAVAPHQISQSDEVQTIPGCSNIELAGWGYSPDFLWSTPLPDSGLFDSVAS